jgi:hypothetical protein
MHRSGTSVTMRAVNLLGVYVGDDADLYPPSFDNRKGVWERKDVVDFHNDLLSHLKGEWKTCLHLDNQWHKSEAVKPFKERLLSLLRNTFSERSLWGWKDPRTCVLLPLWIDVLNDMGVSLSVVFVVRNPLDVARSLYRRSNIPYDKSFGLWFFHNLTALLTSRDCVRRFVSYDRLLGDWEGELKTCADSLALNWPTDDSSLRLAMGEFIRPELRHSASARGDLLREGVPTPVIQLFDLLEGAASQQQIGDLSLITEAERMYADFRSYARFFSDDLVTLWERGKTIEELRVQAERVRSAASWAANSGLESGGLGIGGAAPAAPGVTVGHKVVARIRRLLGTTGST